MDNSLTNKNYKMRPKQGIWPLPLQMERSPNRRNYYYYQISLKEARQARDEAAKLLAHGIDPNEHKAKTKQLALEAKDNTFEKVAAKWFDRLKPTIAISTQRGYIINLKTLCDAIGSRPINEITKQEITALCHTIEKQGCNEKAHRLAKLCFNIFDYLINQIPPIE